MKKLFGKNAHGEIIESIPTIGQIFSDGNQLVKLVSLKVKESTNGVYVKDSKGSKYLAWLDKLTWMPTMSDLVKSH